MLDMLSCMLLMMDSTLQAMEKYILFTLQLFLIKNFFMHAVGWCSYTS